MDKDNAVQKFLADFEPEQSEQFPEQETIFSDKEPEPIVEEEVAPKEKRLPFHKDPKVQRYLDEEIEKRMSQFKPEPVAPYEDNEVREVLEQLIGNDTPEKIAMVKRFENVLEKGTQRARQEALQELDSRQNEQVRADQEAEEELSTAFDTIEDTFDVDITSSNPIARKTRQDFITYVEKIAPKDRNGEIRDYPDMVSAWETFSDMRKSQPSRAKELASRGIARNTDTVAQPQKSVTFEDADAFIESLK
jgi:hypothetical protein